MDLYGPLGHLRLLATYSAKNIKNLFDKYCDTLSNNIDRYDIGYWSLYELSNLRIKCALVHLSFITYCGL